MPTIRVERTVAAAPATVWELLRDFANIDVFNPNLSRSHRIGDTPHEGIGAERHCHMKDGRNWIKERVIDWRPGQGYTVEIYAGTMPIVDIRTSLGVEPVAGGSRASMEIRYRPKFGALGKLADVVVLRWVMRHLMGKVLAGLAEKAEAALPARDASRAA